MLVIVEDDSDEMSVMMITEESTEYVDGSDEEQHGGHDNDDVADGSAITLAARLTLLPSSFHMIHMPTSLLLSSSSSSSSSNASLLEARKGVVCHCVSGRFTTSSEALCFTAYLSKAVVVFLGVFGLPRGLQDSRSRGWGASQN